MKEFRVVQAGRSEGIQSGSRQGGVKGFRVVPGKCRVKGFRVVPGRCRVKGFRVVPGREE